MVVTHGTDTLEETAYVLALRVNTTNPIVVVGAMRPATVISADGPENLLPAVALAATPEVEGRGPMVGLNDRIASAYYVTKSKDNQLDTFKAPEQGHIGYFTNVKPMFYYLASLPLGHHYFNISTSTTLSLVDIHYGHQFVNPALITALVNLERGGSFSLAWEQVAGHPGDGSRTYIYPLIFSVAQAFKHTRIRLPHRFYPYLLHRAHSSLSPPLSAIFAL